MLAVLLRLSANVAAAQCSSAVVVVYGAEAEHPESMGFFIRNDTFDLGTQQAGRPIYEHRSGRLLFYWQNDEEWYVGPTHLEASGAMVRTTGNNAALCPDEALEWQAWDGNNWSLHASLAVLASSSTDDNHSLVDSAAASMGSGSSRSGLAFSNSSIRIGAVLSMDCCSSNSGLGYALLAAYRDFVEWVNVERGGVTMAQLDGTKANQGVELILLGDESNHMRLREAMWRLLYAGVQHFLGPAGSRLSEAAGAVVAASGMAVLVAPAAPAMSATLRMSSAILSTMPSTADQLEPVITGLVSRGMSSLLAVLPPASSAEAAQTGSPFGEDVSSACAELTQLASSLGVQLVEVEFDGAGATSTQLVTELQGLSTNTGIAVCLDEPLCPSFLELLSSLDVNAEAVILSSSCAWNPAAQLLTLQAYAATGAVEVPASIFTDYPVRESAEALTMQEDGTLVASLGDPALYVASAWLAGLSLISALEQKSATLLLPDFSSDALPLPFSTIWTLAQYSPGGTAVGRITAPQELLYPAPSWTARQCLDPGSIRNFGFRPDGSCSLCTSGEMRNWMPASTATDQDAWACTVILCDFGNTIQPAMCGSCPPGAYLNITANVAVDNALFGNSWPVLCQPCKPGLYSSRSDRHECDPCPPGQEAAISGATECQPCRIGRFTFEEATSACEHCPPGRASLSEGSTECIACPSGEFSLVHGVGCEVCPPGSFQLDPGSSACMNCPKGASCSDEGTNELTNLKNWWARVPPVARACAEEDEGGASSCQPTSADKDWFPCNLHSQACMIDEQCREGSTGLLCEVCTPDYTWLNGECVSCPDWVANLVVSIGIGLTLGFGMIALTSISIRSAGKAKSLTSGLLKLLLNYITTMSYMSDVLLMVLALRGEEQIKSRPSEPVRETESILRIMTFVIGTAFENLHSIWSLDCLWQPPLSGERSNNIDTMAAANFSARPAFTEGTDALLDFHEVIQYRSSIFWICLTPGMVLTLLLLMTPLLFMHMRYHRSSYKQAMDFYMRLAKPKTKERVLRKMTAAKVEEFVLAEQYRFMGIWRVVGLTHYRLLDWRFWKKYLLDVLPLVVIIVFVLYPLVLRALLDPLRCVKPTDDVDGSRWSKSVDVTCDYDNAIFWSTVVLGSLWGFCLPTITGVYIYMRATDLQAPRLQRIWGFLVGGYELDRSYWECIVLLRKSLGVMASSVEMSLGTRVVLMVLLAGVFLFLHLHYQPFDNRYNQLLDRIETFHLIAWNIFALVLISLYMLDAESDIAELVLVSSLLVLHFLFAMMMLTYVMQSYVYAFAESYAKHIAAQDVLSVVSHGTVRPSFKDMEKLVMNTSPFGGFLIRMYARRMDKLPYVSFRHRGFNPLRAFVCGDGGAQCRNPPADANPHLFKVAHVPPRTKRPSSDDLRYLVGVIFDAMEYVVVEQERSVFSATLLEFVIRVGFTFGVDGTLRLQDTDSMVLTGAAQAAAVNPQFGGSIAGFWRRGSFAPGVPGLADLVDSMGIGIMGGSSGAGTGGRRASVDSADAGERHSLGEDAAPQPLVVKAPELSSDKHAASVAQGVKLLSKKSKKQKGEELVRVKLTVQTDRVTGFVQSMFESRNFMQGLTIEDLQLNLTARLHRTSKNELRTWFDIFERTWRDRRKASERAARMTGDLYNRREDVSVAELYSGPFKHADAAVSVGPEDFRPWLLLDELTGLSVCEDAIPAAVQEGEEDEDGSPGSASAVPLGDAAQGVVSLWARFVLQAQLQIVRMRSIHATHQAVMLHQERCELYHSSCQSAEAQVLKVRMASKQGGKESIDTETELKEKVSRLRDEVEEMQQYLTRQRLLSDSDDEEEVVGEKWKQFDL